MERDGLVARRVHAEVPPRVEYALTRARRHDGAAAEGARRVVDHARQARRGGARPVRPARRPREARRRKRPVGSVDARRRSSRRPARPSAPAHRNRSSSRARIRGATPGPSSSMHVRARARGRARRARGCPCRGRGRRRRRPRRRSRSRSRRITRPSASGSAAPVAQRREAGAADRHLALTLAPGAAEGVGDHDRAAEPRAQRPRRGVRVHAAAGPACPGAPALEASTPALAHTKPWRVRQISRPASARTSSAASERTTSTRRGSLPCSAASARARSPGATSASAHDAPLGLGDDLVGDREHVGGPQLAGGARAARRGRRRAGPRGGPAARRARSRGGRGREQAREQRARARRRRAAARASAARSASRSSGVSTSSPSDGSSATRTAAPAARRAGGVAGERARAERRLDRAAAGRAAARWSRCRGGRARSPRRRSRASSAPTSPGSSAGQSPGTSSTRSAPCRRAASTPSAAAADWPASRGRATTRRARARAPRRRRRGSAVTTITPVQPADGAQRGEHVAHHRLRQLAARRASLDGRRQPLLGARERLDRQNGGRVIRRGSYPRRLVGDVARCTTASAPATRGPRARTRGSPPPSTPRSATRAPCVNVGAGAGSYEPRDREVTAVEPSEVMIAQRPPDAARVVQATAEALPFADGSFDAAMAVLSDHHWPDAGARPARAAPRRPPARRRLPCATRPARWAGSTATT